MPSISFSSAARLLALGFAFVASICVASPAPAPKPDSLIRLTPKPYVALGMPREDVTFMLGEPTAVLSPVVWVYLDFKATRAFGASIKVPNPESYDALLVVFAADKVSRLRLLTGDVARALIARQKAAASNRPIAAK